MKSNRQKAAELAGDLMDYLAYAKELGVEDLAAGGRRRSTSRLRSKKDSTVKADSAEIAKILGDVRDTRETEPSTEHRTRRSGLLKETKIKEVTNQKQGAKPKKASPAVKKETEATPVAPVSLIPDQLPESNETLADIREFIGADCQRCDLKENRSQVVNSVGSETADLMIVGEAPGADEDAQGEPFVGRAGKLLTKILAAIGYTREQVFIGNINRCRPPGNRQPTLEESAMCKPFLLREIASVKPKVIVVLGNTATKNLLDTKTGITKLRGNFAEYYGVKVMPTFHPAYLLRDPRKKREVWEDMKKVRDYLLAVDDGNE